MEMEIIYISLYVIIILSSLYLIYKLRNLYGEMKLKGFTYLIISLASLIIYSIFSIMNYQSEILIELGENFLNVYDIIMTVSLIIDFLSIFYLVETSKNEHITWKFYVFLFLSGGSLVAESLKPMMLSYIFSSTFEITAISLLIYLIYSYAKELKPYMAKYRYYIIGISGLELLAISLIVGVSSQFAYFFTRISIYDVISELSTTITVVGLYFIILPITLKPLSIFAILAKPKALVILTEEGDPLYEYYFDQRLSSIERANLRDLLMGVYITIKNMIRNEEAYIKLIKTNKFSIVGVQYKPTITLLLAEKTTIMVRNIIEAIHGLFVKELAGELLGKKPKEINMESLGKFDHIIKYYLTQLII